MGSAPANHLGFWPFELRCDVSQRKLRLEGNAALTVATNILAGTMSWGILVKSILARDRPKNSHGLCASLPGLITGPGQVASGRGKCHWAQTGL